MSADIKQIKNRIRSVDSTLHITKAMKLVASSKINHAEKKFKEFREFSDAVDSVMSGLLGKENRNHPAVRPVNPSSPSLYLLIAADRGLAGSFNGALFRMLDGILGENDRVIAVGKRACDYAVRKKLNVPLNFESTESITDGEIGQIVSAALDGYLNGEYSSVVIVANRYKNVLTQYPDTVKLLPLEIGKESNDITEYEPGIGEVLGYALPFCVRSKLTGAIRESFLAEQYARRNAMDSASDNAQEMIDSLTLHYNRARQSSITQEITEIVAGANASD